MVERPLIGQGLFLTNGRAANYQRVRTNQAMDTLTEYACLSISPAFPHLRGKPDHVSSQGRRPSLPRMTYIQKNFIITLHYMKSIYFSYKEVLQNITHNKEACIEFLKKNGIIQNSMTCPGPMYKGQRLNNCGQNMKLKKVNGRKDGLTWRCRNVHCITTEKGQYKVKDVKVSIQHET